MYRQRGVWPNLRIAGVFGKNWVNVISQLCLCTISYI